MSDALNFLVKARPDALGPYFAFLKNSGKYLDPKTRCLISVITKVHAQTERGLRQYLQRALRAGCTPLEVLDALLMAFPALGLAKIVWAAEVILAMDLPGFTAEALQAAAAARDAAAQSGVAQPTEGSPAPAEAAPQWHDLLPTNALAPGETRLLAAAGREVFLHHGSTADGSSDWRVFDSRCPHQGTRLGAEGVRGCMLTCPQHQWAFDLRSGACVAQGPGAGAPSGGAEVGLKPWPSRVVGGQVQACW